VVITSRPVIRMLPAQGGDTIKGSAPQDKAIEFTDFAGRLPLSGAGMDIKTTNINQLLETYGIKSLTSGGEARK